MGGEENMDSIGKEFGNTRKEKRENICVNIISSFKNEQAKATYWEYECGTDLLISLMNKWGLGARAPEGKLTSSV